MRQRGIGTRILLTLLSLLMFGGAVIGGALAFQFYDAWKIKQERLEVYESVPFQAYEPVETGELDTLYYYNTMVTEEEKSIYQEIVEGIRSEQEEIYVHCGDMDQIQQLYNYVLADLPEFFWCDGSIRITIYDLQAGIEPYGEITDYENCTGEERALRQEQVQQVVDAYMETVNANDSEYERICQAYEYISLQTDYVTEAEDNQNLYSALVRKQSVCAGYSKALEYLLNVQGIECTYVWGYAQNSQGEEFSHGWNLVKCEGEYYYIDVTWADQQYTDEEGGALGGAEVDYQYLCCDEETLFQTHRVKEELIMPACTMTDKDYYRLNGMYYETYDEEVLQQAVITSVNAQDGQTTFKFASQKLYQQAYEYITKTLTEVGMNQIMSRYGMRSAKCYYVEDEVHYRIVIQWKYE